jgi:hypothetical protein
MSNGRRHRGYWEHYRGTPLGPAIAISDHGLWTQLLHWRDGPYFLYIDAHNESQDPSTVSLYRRCANITFVGFSAHVSPERVDYYTHMRRVARTDPLTKIDLLSLKEPGKTARPILPLESDDVEVFRHSPLFSLVTPEDDPSEMASSLLGPGPWTFHQDLKLPNSCSLMQITNKNRRSNIIITHHLKCVFRVERGDDLHMDPKTGKRKLFDIVVQTPIQILSVSTFSLFRW